MRGLIVDSFAGGGGASTGIELALGRSPDIAVNHDPEAVALHAANHPSTKHYCESVWKVDPVEATGGRPVDLAWFSPDCKHFSKAKGGKPREQKVRGLAWVVVRWARAVKPRVIILENVEEFATWGPLLVDGTPCPARRGQTFKAWVSKLRRYGYAVEWRELRACDYGAPTIRKRLFVVARCDGQPIVWPTPTHGPGCAQPWRTAAECIDWTIPCPSIFDRERPLAEKTLKRIARGVMKYVVESPAPFVVPVKSWGGGGNEARSVDEPLRTTTTSKRGEHAVVVPTVVGIDNASNGARDAWPADRPIGTIVTENRFAMAAPVLAPVTHGGDHRAHQVDEPFRTVTAAHRGELALAAPVLARTDMHKSNAGCAYPPNDPLRTVTTGGGHALIAPSLVQVSWGEREGQAPRALDPGKPLGTVVAGGIKHAVVAAFLAKHYGGVVGQKVDAPASTVTTQDHHALVTAHAVHLRGGVADHAGARQMGLPFPTVTAGGTHIGLATSRLAPQPLSEEQLQRADQVRAFLVKYYGTGEGQAADAPLGTVTTKDRFGLVTVAGETYAIVDIGMRMLTPRELYRAQGFPDAYRIDLTVDGEPLTKTAQVRMCGNSVCPPIAAALVRANVGELARRVA